MTNQPDEKREKKLVMPSDLVMNPVFGVPELLFGEGQYAAGMFPNVLTEAELRRERIRCEWDEYVRFLKVAFNVRSDNVCAAVASGWKPGNIDEFGYVDESIEHVYEWRDRLVGKERLLTGQSSALVSVLLHEVRSQETGKVYAAHNAVVSGLVSLAESYKAEDARRGLVERLAADRREFSKVLFVGTNAHKRYDVRQSAEQKFYDAENAHKMECDVFYDPFGGFEPPMDDRGNGK